MTAHSADRPASGAGRFAQQVPGSGDAPRRSRTGALFSALALLALIVGIPAGLYVLAAPLLESERLSETLTLTGRLGTDQVLAVLVVVAALAWLQFVVCVLVELGAALRGGVLAAPVPLSGPSQRLARWLVGSMLLVGVMAGQMGVAQASVRPDLGSAKPGNVATAAAYADPDTFYVFDANTAPPKAEPVSQVSSRQLTARQAAAEAANARRSAAQAERVTAGQLSRDELALDGHTVYVVEAPTGRHHDTLWAAPQIDAIWNHDDDQGVGVLAAIENAGRDEFFLVGGAGSANMMREIQDPESVVKATVIYPSTQAADGIKLARLVAHGDRSLSDLASFSVPRTVQLFAPVVTEDNVDDYIDSAFES